MTGPDPRRATPKEPATVLETDDARQGKSGRPVLYVLIGGLTLGALYILGLMLFSGSYPEPTTPRSSFEEANPGVAPPGGAVVPGSAVPPPGSPPPGPPPSGVMPR